MGRWVPGDQINQVLDMCRRANWHIFQLLTKNAPRLRQFDFPANIWVGVSSPPDYLWGRHLTRAQQRRMLTCSLETLGQIDAPMTWMSFEPLSWDVSEIVAEQPVGTRKWAVIGAASNGSIKYPPDEAHLRRLLRVLDIRGIPVFFKGNLRSLPWAAANWREDFPARKPVQLEMFGRGG